MAGCAKPSPAPAPTPAPAPAPAPAPSPAPTPAPPKVEEITSMDFTLTGSTYEGWKGEIRYRGRNLQSENSAFRIEETTGKLRKLIINNAAGEFYSYDGDVWTKYTGLAYTYFQTMSMPFAVMFGTVNALILEQGRADFSITVEGRTVSVTDITVNPTLGDELFSPPSGATVEEFSP